MSAGGVLRWVPPWWQLKPLTFHLPSSPQVSLNKLLTGLGIDYKNLHNAGNDARYTMHAFLSLAAGYGACQVPLSS